MSDSYHGEYYVMCPICDSKKISYWATKSYAYSRNIEDVPFKIFKCNKCLSGFLNPPPSSRFIREIYQYSGHGLSKQITLADVMKSEAEYPNTSIDAARIIQIAHLLNKTKTYTAIDIGSGYGFSTYQLNLHGYETTSVNPGLYENQIFSELNNYEVQKKGLFQDFEYDEKFAIVNLSHVLEHIPNPRLILKSISGKSISGSVLAIAVPNFNSFSVKLFGVKDNSCLWVPEHLNYFTEKGLRLILNEAGYEIVRVDFISRIPYFKIAKILGVREGWLRSLLNILSKYTQKPFMSIFNLLGMGLYINIYAIRK
jgi:SAM-dependent methyltransferase